MRAAFYRRTGPAAEVLEAGDLPDPQPGAGDVVVRVAASGINPADVKRRAGWLGAAMDHPLVVPHCDGAGEIVAVGSGVDGGRIGERVWLWNAQGGYGETGRAFGTAAQLIALPAAQAVRLQDALGFAAGACLGVPAVTGHRAVFADGPVDGQTILVHGGGGAVGHFAVQFAVLGGARVIATAGRRETSDHAAGAGADLVIDRHTDDIAARVMDATDGKGVDRIVDVDFGVNLNIDSRVLKSNGAIAAYSSSTVPVPPLPYYAFAFKGAHLHFVQGFNLPADARRAANAAIAEQAEAGKLAVAVGETFALADIAQAHERVESGQALGNIVVQP